MTFTKISEDQQAWTSKPAPRLLTPGRIIFIPPTHRRSSSPAPHRWTGRSASSLSFSPPQFCRSCAALVPSSDRSFFYGFLSGFPNDAPGPPCAWRKTGMSLCPCPPTRCCPSCRLFLRGPTGTGTNGSSFWCLLENKQRIGPLTNHWTNLWCNNCSIFLNEANCLKQMSGGFYLAFVVR